MTTLHGLVYLKQVYNNSDTLIQISTYLVNNSETENALLIWVKWGSAC